MHLQWQILYKSSRFVITKNGYLIIENLQSKKYSMKKQTLVKISLFFSILLLIGQILFLDFDNLLDSIMNPRRLINILLPFGLVLTFSFELKKLKKT